RGRRSASGQIVAEEVCGIAKLRWRTGGRQAQGILKGEIHLLHRLLGEGAKSEDDFFLWHRGHCLAVNDTVKPEAGSSPRRAVLADRHLAGQVCMGSCARNRGDDYGGASAVVAIRLEHHCRPSLSSRCSLRDEWECDRNHITPLDLTHRCTGPG